MTVLETLAMAVGVFSAGFGLGALWCGHWTTRDRELD